MRTTPTLYAAITAVLQPVVAKPSDALNFMEPLAPDDGVAPQFGRTGREGGFGDRYAGGVGEYVDWFYDGDAGWEV